MKLNRKVIDLRSDTVTLPSPEMWEALKSLDNSKIGDDVYREDPTINELEEKAAKITNKEAGLFVTSGTQGNLVSILSSTNAGDEILVESQSHILLYEVGGAARIGGLTSRMYHSTKGQASFDHLHSLLRPRNDDHQAWTTLICIENTHNKHGGAVIPLDYMKKLRKFASENNLRIHMDGARIFNAVIASNSSLFEYTSNVDTMMFCLSKGLACPVGSLVVGSEEFIAKARKNRKMLGGGMRQAGILAVMGLIALQEKWIKRLKEDHINAKELAKGLRDSGVKIQVQEPETNIILAELPNNIPLNKFILKLVENGIKALDSGRFLRLVTHYGVTQEDISYCIETIPEVLKYFFK